MGPTTQYGDIAFKRKVYYTGSDQLLAGMALCYDGTVSTTPEKFYKCAKPTLANMNRFAGVVTEGQNLKAGAGYVELGMPVGVSHGVPVSTNLNCAVGDLLGVIPGSYYLGPAILGAPIAECLEAVDRSTTAGLVKVDFGSNPMWLAQLSKRILKFEDHFDGSKTISAPAVANAVADAGTYLLTGAGSSASFQDSFNAEKTGTARAAGVLAINSATTAVANLTLNGEPFGLATGQAIFFRARVAPHTVAATSTFAVGISITDLTLTASDPTDGIFFKIADGAVTLRYRAASGTATSVTIATAALDVFSDMVFLAINRGGATKCDLYIFYNDVQIAHTAVGANLAIAESMTFEAEAIGDVARNLYLDLVQVINWVAAA